jgi:hypothetical protein
MTIIFPQLPTFVDQASSATKQLPNSAMVPDTNTRRIQIGGCPRLPIRAWLDASVRLRSFWQALRFTETPSKARGCAAALGIALEGVDARFHIGERDNLPYSW